MPTSDSLRWTQKEHAIVASCSVADAHKRLPHRTTAAIRAVRRKLHVGIAQVKWTEAEDRRLRKYAPIEPIKKLMKRFKHRSKDSIVRRRSALIGTRARRWKITEEIKLRALYPTADRAAIESAIPNWRWPAIKYHAMVIGVRRETRMLPVTDKLRDEVRRRAREDQIPLRSLGAQTGCGSYFCQTNGKRCDFNKIARAVAFFGGKLVIDWQDE